MEQMIDTIKTSRLHEAGARSSSQASAPAQNCTGVKSRAYPYRDRLSTPSTHGARSWGLVPCARPEAISPISEVPGAQYLIRCERHAVQSFRSQGSAC